MVFLISKICYSLDVKINTPIGDLRLVAQNGALTHVFFEGEEYPQNIIEQDREVLEQAKIQLEEYFAGKRKVFTVPINPAGAPFCKKVWEIMVQQIKYGSTICYSDLARLAGSERACRAVGMANNRNPIPIIIPCHRVVGKHGDLVGFRSGLDIKTKLLALEQKKRIY